MDYSKMSNEELAKHFGGKPNMFRHDDPIVLRHMEKVRKLEAENPHRDWKYNLSQEQVDDLIAHGQVE